jgi:hypothetical protein
MICYEYKQLIHITFDARECIAKPPKRIDMVCTTTWQAGVAHCSTNHGAGNAYQQCSWSDMSAHELFTLFSISGSAKSAHPSVLT